MAELPETPVPAQPRKMRYRVACPLLLLIWIPVLICPCLFVTLLVEKELTYSVSAVPEHEYRLFFLDSPDSRGFGLVRPNIESGGEDEDFICMVISVDYLMWEGESEPSRYCSCYEKSGDSWFSLPAGEPDHCQPLEVDPGE